MADRIQLQVEKREELGSRSVRSLRSSGYLPAVIYGNGFDTIPLKVDYKKFKETFKDAGSSTMINLKINNETHPVIIQEVSKEPVSSDFLHADFYKVSLDEKIHARIPLEFVGESPAVKELGGVFTRNINEVEVYAFPQNLPPNIEVDISGLNELGQSITIKDLKIVDDIELQAEEDEVVATVVEPREEEEEITEEVSVEDVEVIAEKKEEEGEEAKEEDSSKE